MGRVSQIEEKSCNTQSNDYTYKRSMIKIIISLCALFAGGTIYLLWRSDTLLMFYWLEQLGIIDVIKGFRINLASYRNTLPNWFIYSLPNALWFYSGLLLLKKIWEDISPNDGIYWIICFCLIAFGSEIIQIFNLIGGTFDFVDLFLMIIAGLLFLIQSKFIKGNSQNE